MVLKVIWMLIMLKFQILFNAKYKLYSIRSYIKLSKELDHVVKRLVIIQNIDSNECFWSDIWILKIIIQQKWESFTKIFQTKLDSKDIILRVKIRDITKLKKRIVSTLKLFAMKTRKIYNQCVKKILSKDILIQLKSQVNG